MAIGCPSLRLSLVVLVAVLCTAPHISAQQPPQTAAVTAPLPVFDVASIRENKSASNSVSVRWGGDAYTATNVTLTSLVMSAYNIREDLISGLPGWADSTHFDVNAKVSEPDVDALKKLTREQRNAMMATFLTERFHLRTHIVVKTLPVYDLVIAKGGHKLTENTTVFDPTAPGTGPNNMKPGSMRINNTEMTAVGIPTSNLAQNLAFQVQRNVIDKTGLTGKYDFTLKWTPTERQGKTDADNNAPDLFTALQEQLGLKLESSKGPVDTLVVDHVEMPTENLSIE